MAVGTAAAGDYDSLRAWMEPICVPEEQKLLAESFDFGVNPSFPET